ncbi:MAG TPA: Rieske (2Fe-2S) protein [Caldithrix abyssi]|uniref:Rieske (2Fe-2S) protein n=1 Tax=Caldithrix abyssi TaxID=187145 RepID=A0A7V1PU07_CALAY|nr:Rieske (2Fe-2S) protein [Caldithrix abyssi]
MKRNRFLNIILGGGTLAWLGSIFYPVFSFLNPPKRPEANVHSVKAGPADKLAVNSGEIIKFGRRPVLLIRMDTGEVRAFSATCTHLDCIVQYRQDSKQIWCACHNGYYDLRGRNISGPPPRPLDVYPVNIVNNEIIVSKPKQMG